MPGKALFRIIALTPILAPSLLAAISFIQWFGNQGAAQGRCSAARSVYGAARASSSASIYATFPHALMIVLTALLLADGRLYEAAESLRHADAGASSSRSRCPGAKYGLVSAAMVVFSYTVSDFGIPKVIGGNFNVLAVDIYKQVIGQQNFNKGAVVSLVLLRAGAGRVRRRLADAGAAAGAVLGARRAVRRRSAQPLVRRRDVRLLPRRRAAAARGAGHGGLHVVHQALAVRPVASACATTRSASSTAA